ncbi:MAG: glycosyl hydrolase [Aeromicrobium sp.]|jgi:unsaturated chondroitin disaccharide hydrolase|uniref:glycoside hydrolase family 88 protein n=1 Tax=Aeromicrobium sp. TaxID=1871063 RepID=UPI0026178F4C|nr:glycoside hydrolase family 88 protein [Aeromicrobium sp.]MCW2825687.1 glycosyl hydrolase [Aeromicrobium sp.]
MTTSTPRWDRLVQLAQQEGAAGLAHPTTHQQYTENGAWVRLPIDSTSGWTKDGSYDHGNWMAGFAPGVQWIVQLGTRPAGEVAAEQRQALAEVARRQGDTTTHDLGFLFHPAFALGQQLGYLDAEDSRPGIEAARTLARRFRPGGGYIQAFGELDDPRAQATSTIDTMMNLPLLWWASESTGDLEMAKIAYRHAKKSAALFRDDFSTYHLATYDPATGEVLDRGTFQGADKESCWTRGQAWAIAGYAWSYAVTGDEGFRELSRRAWDYFDHRLPADGVAPWDFSDVESGTEDASASAIAALGALILAETVESGEAEALRARANKVLDLLLEHAVRTDQDEEGILLRSCYSKPHGKGLDGALPYGDFYFVLAVALADGVLPLSQITPQIDARTLRDATDDDPRLGP